MSAVAVLILFLTLLNCQSPSAQRVPSGGVLPRANEPASAGEESLKSPLASESNSVRLAASSPMAAGDEEREEEDRSATSPVLFVRGAVVEARDGPPVASAEIFAVVEHNSVTYLRDLTTCDAEGEFTIDLTPLADALADAALDKLSVRLLITAPGFRPLEKRSGLEGRVDGCLTMDCAFDSVLTNVITGRLLTRDGWPASSAQVRFRSPSMRGHGVTDGSGYFQVPLPAAGETMELTVKDPLHGTWSLPVRWRGPRESIHVGTHTLEPWGVLAGTLESANGLGLFNRLVALEVLAAEGALAIAVTDEEGRFRFQGLDPALSYRLTYDGSKSKTVFHRPSAEGLVLRHDCEVTAIRWQTATGETFPGLTMGSAGTGTVIFRQSASRAGVVQVERTSPGTIKMTGFATLSDELWMGRADFDGPLPATEYVATLETTPSTVVELEINDADGSPMYNWTSVWIDQTGRRLTYLRRPGGALSRPSARLPLGTYTVAVERIHSDTSGPVVFETQVELDRPGRQAVELRAELARPVK